jgi:hypothetical protein
MVEYGTAILATKKILVSDNGFETDPVACNEVYSTARELCSSLEGD